MLVRSVLAPAGGGEAARRKVVLALAERIEQTLQLDLRSPVLRSQLTETLAAVRAVDGLCADQASALSEHNGDSPAWLTAVAAAAAAQGDMEFALAVLQAAAPGSPAAALELAGLHSTGAVGASSEQRIVLAALDKAAGQGHPSAQYLVGTILDDGTGVRADEPLALVWYGRSAEQGYPPACHALGQKYELGHCVDQCTLAAFRWYKHGASRGHAESQLSIGKLFYAARDASRAKGGDGKEEEEKAREWLERAAAGPKGSVEASQLLRLVGPSRRPLPSAPATAAPSPPAVMAPVGSPARARASRTVPPPSGPPLPRGRTSARTSGKPKERKVASQPPPAAPPRVWEQLKLPEISMASVRRTRVTS